MSKTAYRVGEGANLALYPRGTKVGAVVHLTEGQAMYERDLGRITRVSDEAKEGSADGVAKEAVVSQDLVVPGETKAHPADAVTGEAIALSDEDRAAIQSGPDIGPDDGSKELGQGKAGKGR